MKRRPLRERFEEKVDVRGPDECWPWLGSIASHGYGQINSGVSDVPLLAHRVAYQLYIGPIPAGAQIDHVTDRGCVLRHCVNPAHLEAVTPQENRRRQTAAGRVDWQTGLRAAAAKRAARTECMRGHAYSEQNTGRRRSTGYRYCKVCQRERQRK